MILAFSLMCFKKAPQIGKPACIASAKTPPQNGWWKRLSPASASGFTERKTRKIHDQCRFPARSEKRGSLLFLSFSLNISGPAFQSTSCIHHMADSWQRTFPYKAASLPWQDIRHRCWQASCDFSGAHDCADKKSWWCIKECLNWQGKDWCC